MNNSPVAQTAFRVREKTRHRGVFIFLSTTNAPLILQEWPLAWRRLATGMIRAREWKGVQNIFICDDLLYNKRWNLTDGG